MAWQQSDHSIVDCLESRRDNAGGAEMPVFVHLSLVLMLGLWIPPFLADWYRAAAKLIG